MPRAGASPSPPRPSPSPFPLLTDSCLPRDARSPRTHSATETAGPGAGQAADPSQLPQPREACTPVRKGAAGGSGCGGEDGSRPDGGRRRRRGARAVAERSGAGRRPGPAREGRRLRTSSARRGRVSGERRPAPQSASSGPAGS